MICYLGSELVVAGKLEDDNVKHLNLEVLGNSADGGIVLSTSADDIALDLSDTSGQTTVGDFATITGMMMIKDRLKTFIKTKSISNTPSY